MKNRWRPKPVKQFDIEGPDASGFKVVFEENYQVASLGELLERFYRHNHYDATPCHPISSHLEVGETEREEGWWFIYYKRFHIYIEQNYHSNHGPHIMKLRYTAEQVKRIYWLATLQLECFFFQEQLILPNLYVAIRDRKFFQSEYDAKQIVVT